MAIAIRAIATIVQNHAQDATMVLGAPPESATHAKEGPEEARKEAVVPLARKGTEAMSSIYVGKNPAVLQALANLFAQRSGEYVNRASGLESMRGNSSVATLKKVARGKRQEANT